MKRLMLTLGILLLTVLASHAEMIRLKDGTVINGSVVEQNSEYIVIESSLGRIKIEKYRLSAIDFDGSHSTPKNKPNMIIQNQPTNPVNTMSKSDTLTKQRLEQLLKKGKIKKNSHQRQIQMLSSQLPLDYNRMLYSNYKKRKFLLYSVLNTVPALGSIMQRDFWGVTFISAGYLSSYMFLMNGHRIYSYYPSSSFVQSAEESYMTAATLLIATISYSLLRPLTYQIKYNKGLKNALFKVNTLSMANHHDIYTYHDSYTVPVASFSF